MTEKRETPGDQGLGSPSRAAHLQGHGLNEIAVQTLKGKADERAAGLASTISVLKGEGISPPAAWRACLTRAALPTPGVSRWTTRSILNV